MNLPEIGKLNHRVTFQTISTVVNEGSGFTNKVKSEFETWGRIEAVGAQIFWETSQINSTITHRIFVRAVKGRTYPSDFKNVVWAVSEGVKYKIMRVTDVNAAHRFTMLEACADGVK